MTCCGAITTSSDHEQISTCKTSTEMSAPSMCISLYLNTYRDFERCAKKSNIFYKSWVLSYKCTTWYLVPNCINIFYHGDALCRLFWGGFLHPITNHEPIRPVPKIRIRFPPVSEVVVSEICVLRTPSKHLKHGV